MKIVPAGISKSTGKPYESFETCSARCGFKVSQKPGYTTIVRESQKLSQVPAPNGNANELRERTMVMSYAKDVVVALIARDQVIGAPGKEVIAIYRELMSELTNPLR
jgi:hypothetical protein